VKNILKPSYEKSYPVKDIIKLIPILNHK